MGELEELEKKITEIEKKAREIFSKRKLERNLFRTRNLLDRIASLKRELQLYWRLSQEIERLEKEIEEAKETLFTSPLISLIKPTEGQKFKAKEEVFIEWETQGPVGSTLEILIFQILPSGPVLIRSLGRFATSKKKISWKIPEKFFTGTFQIEVFDDTTGIAALSGKFLIEKE